MRKIAVAIMAVCFLFFLPVLLSAQKTFEINFSVVDKLNDQQVMTKVVNIGENYVCVMQKEDLIKWKCDYPFALVFSEDAFAENVPDRPKAKERKPKDNVILNHAYKYSIVVFVRDEVVALDPVIIIIPPRR